MRSPKTLADLRSDPRIESIHREDDGCFQDSMGRYQMAYWVYLKPGLICTAMECGTIHEPSIKRVAEMLRTVRATRPDEEGHCPELHDHNVALAGS